MRAIGTWAFIMYEMDANSACEVRLLRFDIIQGTLVDIQGTFVDIQGTFINIHWIMPIVHYIRPIVH
jgi:hypothetical protein